MAKTAFSSRCVGYSCTGIFYEEKQNIRFSEKKR